MNARQSAIDAGYSPKSAHTTATDLLKLPYVKEQLEMLNAKQEKRTIMTVAELREFWTRVANGEEMDGDRPTSMRDRLKAAELLGKSTRAFIDQVEVSGPGGGPVQLNINGDPIDIEKLGW
jgi:phage terminase small subunit